MYSIKNISRNAVVLCDKIIIGLLLAAVTIIPLFFDIRLYSVFDLSKVAILYLLTIMITSLWAAILIFRPEIRPTRTALDIPILVYLVVFIISSILSINPVMSLLGTYKRFEGLSATVCYLLIFYATVNFVTTKKRLYLLMVALVAGATVASGYGIAQHLGFDLFKWSTFQTWRVFSTFGNPVFFSAYLVMTLPLAVVLFFNLSFQKSKGRHLQYTPATWTFLALSLIIYTAFWLTNTRACFVALLGSFIPFLVLVFPKNTAERYRFGALIVSLIALGVFFNVRYETSIVKHKHETTYIKYLTGDTQPTGKHDEQPSQQKAVAERPSVFYDTNSRPRPEIARKYPVSGSSFSRIFQYLAAIEIIKDYPILGIGPDTTGIVYQKYLAKVFSVEESDNGFHFPRQDRIHNDVLDTTVTRGFIGLATYIWLLTAFGVYVKKNYHRLTNQHKIALLGLLSGILCYLIQNEFSFGNTPISTIFWVLMGLCISVIKINEAEKAGNTDKTGLTLKTGVIGSNGVVSEACLSRDGATTRPHIVYRGLCCSIVMLALGLAALFVFRIYKADVYFEYGRRLMAFERENRQAIPGKGIFIIETAVQLNPYETFYRDELCRSYLQLATITKDETWMQKAYAEARNSLGLIPQHFIGFFHLGLIYQTLAEHFNKNTVNEAVLCYKKAIEEDPFQAPFYGNLASLYHDKSNLDTAISALYQAHITRPEEPGYVGRLVNAYLQKSDLQNALIYSRRITALLPSEPAYYSNLGAILYKTGKYEDAASSFKKAVALKPGDAAYVQNLASAYSSLEKEGEALELLKGFDNAYPHHNSIQI
ncbi:MAG: O-antigen ligase family protein, partial [Planctomycetes bacterium]|nr:O-antigen ligase family protein [Planctomycetota bacterium]